MDPTRQLAHEIQGPLISLELQLRKLLDESPRNAVAERCLAEVSSLQALVTSVLELGPRGVIPTSIELAPLFERLESRYRPIAEARHLRLTMKCHAPCARADARAMERILGNLIDNAIKFSHANGRVDVRARSGNGSVEVEVRDDGVGIAAEARERVFEPFFRVDREVGGHGLGLAISKQLAEAQGGSLRCESAPGSGSSFTLTLSAK